MYMYSDTDIAIFVALSLLSHASIHGVLLAVCAVSKDSGGVLVASRGRVAIVCMHKTA
jgi:hypothetical protein